MLLMPKSSNSDFPHHPSYGVESCPGADDGGSFQILKMPFVDLDVMESSLAIFLPIARVEEGFQVLVQLDIYIGSNMLTDPLFSFPRTQGQVPNYVK